MLSPIESRIIYYPDIAHIPLDSYLTAEEVRGYTHKQEDKRPGWLASRYAAKQAVQALWPETQPTDVAISHLPSGAPILHFHSGQVFLPVIPGLPPLGSEPRFRRDPESTSISLSHSGSYGAAVIAVGSSCHVGVDIEQIRLFRPCTLRAFTTESERKWLKKHSPANQALGQTLLWSVKEACLKALSTGLHIHPAHVEITLDHSHRVKFIEVKNNSMQVKNVEWFSTGKFLSALVVCYS